MERGKESKPHQVILDGRKKLLVSGVEEAECFDESFAVLRTSMGRMEIQGEELCISDFSADSGNLSLTGKVSAVFYTDDIRPLKRKKRGER